MISYPNFKFPFTIWMLGKADGYLKQLKAKGGTDGFAERHYVPLANHPHHLAPPQIEVTRGFHSNTSRNVHRPQVVRFVPKSLA